MREKRMGRHLSSNWGDREQFSFPMCSFLQYKKKHSLTVLEVKLKDKEQIKS